MGCLCQGHLVIREITASFNSTKSYMIQLSVATSYERAGFFSVQAYVKLKVINGKCE